MRLGCIKTRGQIFFRNTFFLLNSFFMIFNEESCKLIPYGCSFIIEIISGMFQARCFCYIKSNCYIKVSWGESCFRMNFFLAVFELVLKIIENLANLFIIEIFFLKFLIVKKCVFKISKHIILNINRIKNKTFYFRKLIRIFPWKIK